MYCQANRYATSFPIPPPATPTGLRAIAECSSTPATVGMKFVSPIQRGTMCQWRWPGTPAPAARPRFRPMLNPCGCITFSSSSTIRAIVCDNSSCGVVAKLVEPGDVPPRGNQQMPVVVGVSVQQRDRMLSPIDDQPLPVVARRAPPGRGSSRIGAGQQIVADRTARRCVFSPRMYPSRHGAQSCSFDTDRSPRSVEVLICHSVAKYRPNDKDAKQRAAAEQREQRPCPLTWCFSSWALPAVETDSSGWGDFFAKERV